MKKELVICTMCNGHKKTQDLSNIVSYDDRDPIYDIITCPKCDGTGMLTEITFSIRKVRYKSENFNDNPFKIEGMQNKIYNLTDRAEKRVNLEIPRIVVYKLTYLERTAFYMNSEYGITHFSQIYFTDKEVDAMDFLKLSEAHDFDSEMIYNLMPTKEIKDYISEKDDLPKNIYHRNGEFKIHY